MRSLIVAALLVGCPKPVPVEGPTPAAPAARGQLPADAGLPARPEQIPVTPVEFVVPERAAFRSELAGGIPLYHAESREFPLVEVRLSFRGGAYLDPAGKAGLATAMGALVRTGGSATHTPDALDEAFDQLAAQVSVSVGETRSTASLNCLKDELDACLDLFVGMLRSPRFDAGRLKVLKDGRLEAMRKRNDDASDVLAREWDALMYGRDHYLGRVSTKADLDAIDAAGMKAMHARIFHPGNLIVQVSGDVSRDDITKRLDARFAGWAKGELAPAPPAPTAELKPGLYHVQKEIPQGKVRFGMRGITRDDPDALAIRVMNDILGGGGFTSRITKKVRSDEGLAYGARSAFASQVEFPGEFVVWTESKNETVALATQLMLAEVRRIRTEPVSTEELETAKTSLIATFPRTFESKAGTLALFADDEMTGRPDDYWSTYRERVAAITADDVLRVAQEHLDPEKLAFLVVGDWEPIAAGDLGKRASMAEFHGGAVQKLPLRDPLTDRP